MYTNPPFYLYRKLFRSILLVMTTLILSLSFYSNAYAEEAASPMTISIDSVEISITVPSTVPVMFNPGNVNVYPDNFNIRNNSDIPVYLSQWNVVHQNNGWNVVTSDCTNNSLNTKNISIAIGEGDNTGNIKNGSHEYLINSMGSTTNITSTNEFKIEDKSIKNIGFNITRPMYTKSGIMNQDAIGFELKFSFDIDGNDNIDDQPDYDDKTYDLKSETLLAGINYGFDYNKKLSDYIKYYDDYFDVDRTEKPEHPDDTDSLADNIVFTDATAPEHVDINYSLDADGDDGIACWFEDRTFYISTQKPGKKVTAPASIHKLFNNCDYVKMIDARMLDTSKVLDMSNAFSDINNDCNINLSGWDTSNVKDMSSMFFWCTSKTLDVSMFDTSNVSDMSYMFACCTILASIDVSNFNTEKVTNMENMFSKCPSLTTLDLSNFNTSNVTNMFGMFDGLDQIISLNVSSFDTSKVTNMFAMFRGLSKLNYIDITNFKTDSVTNISCMFERCSNLNTLDLSNFNVSNIYNDADYMFRNCVNLKTIFTSGDFKLKYYSSSMFTNCNSIVGGNGTTYIGSTSSYACIDKPNRPGYFTLKI